MNDSEFRATGSGGMKAAADDEEAMDKETQIRVRDAVLTMLQNADLDTTTEFKIRNTVSDFLGINLHLPNRKAFVKKIIEIFIVSTAEVSGIQETENLMTSERKTDVEETENLMTSERKTDVEETENLMMTSERKTDVEETENLMTSERKSDVEEETENPISGDQSSKMKETKKKGSMGSDNDESVICHLSKNRRVSIQEFKGMKLVSIREFYEKNGIQLPSHKGISLTCEQWAILRKSTSKIEAAVAKLK
ncbi:hypothetical protein ZOSMA_148G00230 [Zostera marina]|uniref:DEK-C domain-containing protein n=1 Tax=Zostera marina TaxID=29655 RepID=A0A0K9PZ26_ZOSMR|nr:hypothetical protein ZOSMA_148G00230 [Zostera marina]